MSECPYCGKNIKADNYMAVYCNMDHFKKYWEMIRKDLD